MKDLKTVMKNPPILSIPDNLVLVYDHFIELWAMQLNGQFYPDNGTFSKIFNRFMSATITTDKIIVNEKNKEKLSIDIADVAQATVLIKKVNYQNFMAGGANEGPMYLTLLIIEDKSGHNYYFNFMSALGAWQLVTNPPKNLKVVDPLNIKRLPSFKNEYEIVAAINDLGFAKFIAGTGYEFLDLKPSEVIKQKD